VRNVDVYFSADVETDGPIPGPFSMLSFGLVVAGRFDGDIFERPRSYDATFYAELCPISDRWQPEAMKVNGLDRDRLVKEGRAPTAAMNDASAWIRRMADGGRPVLAAYPLSFDWSWLYWYFVSFANEGSPFEHSRCFDMKTAYAVKARIPLSQAGLSKLPDELKSRRVHSHNALDDAIEQAEIFANIFEWGGRDGSGA
jgi:hypothetical protein